MTQVVVVGAGIAGLAFTIKMLQLQPDKSKQIKIVVLETGFDDESRKGLFSHSMSIRKDIGGIQSLEKMQLLDEFFARSTGSEGMFIARPDGALVFSTKWLNTDNRHGGRIVRYQLWKMLLDHAVALGADVRFGAKVLDADLSDSSVVRVSYAMQNQDEAQIVTIDADAVLVCDGARSALRASLTKNGAQRTPLNVGIVGLTVAGLADQVPEHMRAQHGMMIGDRSICFVSSEGDGSELVSVSLPIEHELTRHALFNDADTRALVLRFVAQYPDVFAAPLRKAIEEQDPKLFLVNALDRMPHEPLQGRLAFLGDASHAVSPFGGSGANMALVDGVTLAETLHAETKDLPEDVDRAVLRGAVSAAMAAFYKASSGEVIRRVERQRTMASILHDSTLKARTARALITTLPRIFAPGAGVRLLLGVSAVVAVVGIAFTFRNNIAQLISSASTSTTTK